MNRKPIRQLWFGFAQAEYDLFHANSTSDHPTKEVQILERALNCENMFKALARVEHNGGCPGIDGVTVEELRGHLREVWPRVRQSLLDGTYRPQPVQRVSIPKPTGGMRHLGVPTLTAYCTSYNSVLERQTDFTTILDELQTHSSNSFSLPASSLIQ